MTWDTTNEIYNGFWEDNKQNGFGKHVWLEPEGKLKNLRNRYEGFWYDGKRHGIGCFWYSNGAKYEGEWYENKKDGFAVYTESTGELKVYNLFF